MSEAYAREILKRNVAQICQTIGWNGINSTPLDILVHVLEKYIRTLGTKANEYAEQFNRTEPNLNDLGLVFRDLHVHLPELAEYTRSVPPVPPPFNVDRFPKPKESNLNFLKPGSHEVVTRPMHVHEHLPPMYPEKERDTPAVADTVEIRQNGIETIGPSSSSSTCQSPEISVTDSPEKHKEIFKRPIDPVSLPTKRPRLRLEEEERTREISSVMMTMSGFLSPAREGKLPEARSPIIISEKHKANSHHPNLIKGPHLLDKIEKKSKKSKLVNGKVVKNKRKDKSHKSESSKSKDNKLDKFPPGYPSKNKDIHPTHHNHVTMPAPKPPPGLSLPLPTMIPPAVDNLMPVIKQEPLDIPASPISRTVALPGEESIPVPRKIPISKSPLVANTLPVNRHGITTPLLSDTEIKTDKLDNEEKLTSQPDRSKVNIFKRITNKTKEDRSISEVVHDKSHSDILISRLQSEDGLRNHNSEHSKRQGPLVNNNDSVAVDLTKRVNLTTNEFLAADDNFENSFGRNYPEPRPIPIPINKNSHLTYGKDIPGVSPKIKKERKHKDKKEKSVEKAAKLLKKQQLAMSMAQVANQNINNFKMSNLKPPKSSRPKNESKIPHIPSGFPLYSNLPPGRGFMPTNPGLIPHADFLAGLTNNALGLAHPNLLASPYGLVPGGPGLIPRQNFLPGGMGPGMLPMSMGNFGHSSKSQTRNIPPMLRRPSLEVIPVENDNTTINMMHKSHLVNAMREKDKHDKHRVNPIPNIQKHKKSHKEHHKSNISKMPVIQPDITIELNPPRIEPVKEEPTIKVPSPQPPPVIEHHRLLEPEVLSPTNLVKVEKSEKKKDKSHKKEKKEKDGIKLKKKKEKKDKNKEKDKSEKKRDKEEKQELKDRIKKEKKEKKKEKSVVDGLVPKLTLRLGTNSPMPPSSPDIFKLNIKPIVKRDEDEVEEETKESVSRGHSRSPELAQISALVTRPPKQKHSSKQNHVADLPEPKSPTQPGSSPPRKNRPPSSHSKYKRILFKPISKKGNTDTYDDSESIVEPPAQTTGSLPSPYYMDEHGNKIWVCPACGRPDNGSPMIGCDGCDCWYHWVCVGISEEPGSAEDWFCKRCAAKREAMALAGEPTHSKKRGRKSKMDRMKDCH